MAGRGIPIVWQRVSMLGGVDEGASELLLSAFLSPEGSQNFRLTKAGLAESVNGYSILNSSAIVTNSGSSAVKVVAGYHYRSIASGAVTRRDVVIVDDGTNEYEIWHSTNAGAAWSFLADLGSTAVNLRCSFAQYENTLIMCFGGAITPRTYDGSSVAVAGQTQPSVCSVAAGSANVLALDGVYKYKVAVIDSNGLVGPASVATAEIDVQKLEINLTSIPTGAGGSLGRRIFRTSGDGELFYKVTDIDDNSTTTHTDALNDKGLLDNAAQADNHGDPPPVGAHFCFNHRSRVFYLGTNAYPNRFWWADIGNPDSVDPASFERVGEGEQGDLLVGGFPEYEGEAILQKEQSLWVLQGSSRSTFNLIRTQAETGCVHERATVLVPGNSVYTSPRGELQTMARPSLAMITRAKDIRLFDGSSDRIISTPIKDFMLTMNYANRAKAWAVGYSEYKWVLFAIPTSGDTDPTYGYRAWDRDNGSWHPVVGFPGGGCAFMSESASDGSILMVGEALKSTGGRIYRFFTGTSLAGSNMTVTFRSKPFTGGKEQVDKMLRSIIPLLKATSSSVSISIKHYTNFADTGATAFATHTVDMETSNANLDEPDPVFCKNTSGRYPVAKAHVIEFTITGTDAIGLYGWMHGMQFWPREH